PRSTLFPYTTLFRSRLPWISLRNPGFPRPFAHPAGVFPVTLQTGRNPGFPSLPAALRDPVAARPEQIAQLGCQALLRCPAAWRELFSFLFQSWDSRSSDRGSVVSARHSVPASGLR